MKQIVRVLSLVLALSLVFTICAWAQSTDTSRGGGGGRGGGFMRWDAKTVTSISGTVVSVDTMSRGGGPGGFLSLTLSVNTEKLTVRLGPSSYFEEQKITINPKDKLTIKASKTDRNGTISYIAGEITKDKKTYQLRDADGNPKWPRGGGGGGGAQRNN